jgi:UDPglucose 6-dehydrogenase
VEGIPQPGFRGDQGQPENPVIFDGRNLYDPKFVRGSGIEYFAIGR